MFIKLHEYVYEGFEQSHHKYRTETLYVNPQHIVMMDKSSDPARPGARVELTDESIYQVAETLAEIIVKVEKNGHDKS